METKGFFKFEIIINVLASSFRFFKYLCYGCTAIRNMLILTVWRSALSDVYIRHILTYKDDLRTERVNNGCVGEILIMT